LRKLLVFAAVLAGASPGSAFAQATGPRDGTTNVTSDRIGMPGTINDPVANYQSQRALNNIPADENAKALAAKLGRARPAKAAELTAGAPINDNMGVAMATIERVDPDGVIVSMGAAKIKVPADAFGHNNAGLLLDMTRAQFEQVVVKANAAS